MADPIGQIFVDIAGNWSKLQQDLLKAEALAQQAGLKIAEALNAGSAAGDAVGPLTDVRDALAAIRMEASNAAMADLAKQAEVFVIAAVAAAAAVVAFGGAITHLVLEEGAAAESTNNLANRLNLSFEETKKLSEMAQIAGVSVESLGRVSMRLADALEDPAGAGKKVAEALNKMGIQASDSGTALVKLLEKLAEIPDATERISKAHEIMGRGAIQLEPLLRNYSELSAAVESLGGQLSGEMVQGLLKADDAADKLGIAWSHLKENLAATFAPAVTAGLDTLTHFLSTAPPDSLDKQIAQLTMEIHDLGEQAKDTGFSLSRMFAASTGMGGIEAEGAGMANFVKQQKEAALRELESKKEAFERSKEYNAELDRLANESQKHRMVAEENAKKLAEAWHKQNLEDIKAEDKAREDSAKANEKLNDQFIKAGEKLNEAIHKTDLDMDKAWSKYIEGANKSAQKQTEVTRSIEETIKAGVRLPGVIGTISDGFEGMRDKVVEAIKSAERFQELAKFFRVDLATGLSETILKFDEFAQRSESTLEQVEGAWARANAEIQKLARYNLPEAIKQTEILIASLTKKGAAQGTILKLQEQELDLIIRQKELSGTAATEEIVNLELVRLKQEALVIQTRALGDAYVALIRTFENAFDALGKGIADAIVQGKSLGDVFKKVGEQIYSDIVHLIVEGAFKQLKAAIIEHIDLFGKLGAAAKTAAVQLPEGIGKIPGAGGIPGKAPSGGTPSTGAGTAGGGLLDTLSGLASIGSLISDVIGNFQFYAMNKSLDIIVKHTLETVNELRNARRDAWDQQTNLFYKLDDMWNEIRNVVDVLKLIGITGGGGGNTEDFIKAFAELINSRPASVDGSTQALLDAEKKAYNDVIHSSDGVSYGLQALTPQIENLSSAVDSASVAFDQISQGVQGAVAPMVKAFDDVRVGFTGYDATRGSGQANAIAPILPADMYGFHGYDATRGPSSGITFGGDMFNRTVGFAPGNNAGEKNIGYVVVNAVDPSGRQIANATITGLEERGIRVR